MANTLTGLYQTIYAALNVVSRELIGFVPAVSMDSRADMVTLMQPIRSPVVPAMTASDITPGNVSASGDDRNVSYVDLQITKQRKISFHMTGEEEKGLMAGGSKFPIAQQSFEQAFRALGNEIEADLAGLAYDTSRAYGTAGSAPFNTADDLTEATETMKILDDNGAPRVGRSLVLNTSAVAKLLGKQPAIFRVNEAGDEMSRRFGMLQMMFGFAFGTSGQLAPFTASTTALAANGAAAVGDTEITIDGGGAASLKKGDIVTFAGHDDKYVVNAATATSLTISQPGLRAAVADNAAITKGANYTPNVAFSRDAFHLAARVPAIPEGGDGADDRTYVMDPVSGLVFEIAIYRQYRQISYEVGICWGVKTVNPEHSAILLG